MSSEEESRAEEFALVFDLNDRESIRSEANRWKRTEEKYYNVIAAEIESFNRILFQINDTAHVNFDELRMVVIAIGHAYADHATAQSIARLLTHMAGDDVQ